VTTKVFQTRRIETLTTVWQAFNDIEEEQRNEIVMDAVALQDAHVRSVNLLLMRSLPFLLDDERSWSLEVVGRIVETDAMMRSLRERGLPGAGWWLQSASQPIEASVAALAATALRETKDALGARYAAWGVSRILDRFSVVDQAAAAAVRYSLRASCGVR